MRAATSAQARLGTVGNKSRELAPEETNQKRALRCPFSLVHRQINPGLRGRSQFHVDVHGREGTHDPAFFAAFSEPKLE